VSDLSHPAISRVVEAAARKGVKLDITIFDASTHTAEEAAAVVGADLGQIVKSLIFVAPRGEGRLVPVVCLVSGRNRVDLSILAAITGEMSIRRATAREARELTGFSVGGIPPFGFGHGVRVVMDKDLCPFRVVWAAAGTDSAVFPVPPGTLRALSNAIVCDIAEASKSRVPAQGAIEPRLNFGTGTSGF
jgi:prolyl-tRNA editing enzyme YbaK/EbsC (Cys-tRNA(Pro) deacylase)